MGTRRRGHHEELEPLALRCRIGRLDSVPAADFAWPFALRRRLALTEDSVCCNLRVACAPAWGAPSMAPAHPRMNANLYALLYDHFAEHAEQPCLLIPGGPVIHYDDLDAASARIAHTLRAAGCLPGDRVAVQVDKSWEALALYLACLRAGFVYLPLNTGYQTSENASELPYFFSDAEPKVIVCRPDTLQAIEALRPQATVMPLHGETTSLVARSAEQPASFDTVQSGPGDLAAILYTSGTTGRSKGAMLTHRNLGSNALTLVEAWGFTRGDVLLHALPIYHVHGLFVACHCVLLSGSRMLWLPKFDAKQVVSLLPQASVMMGVPTFYSRLLAEPGLDASACRNIRLFVSGSAPLLPDTFNGFQARTGHAILERYGMTETGMNTSNPLLGERIAGTVGPALPGVSVRVVDGDGRPCAPGAVGAIQVKGPNVFSGYWRMPEKTREEFTPDGFFKTGDLGELLPNRYVKIVGRAKDMIISGGLNVYPKEIEEKIDSLPGVFESAVIGIPDADFGEAVTAVVVANPGCAPSEDEIIAKLKAEIANFKVPKRVHMVDELPRNAMGKVEKSVLRQRFARAHPAAQHSAPLP
jgi:malonyl-CoA/methylmalonyl-CoA synthetase